MISVYVARPALTFDRRISLRLLEYSSKFQVFVFFECFSRCSPWNCRLRRVLDLSAVPRTADPVGLVDVDSGGVFLDQFGIERTCLSNEWVLAKSRGDLSRVWQPVEKSCLALGDWSQTLKGS